MLIFYNILLWVIKFAKSVVKRKRSRNLDLLEKVKVKTEYQDQQEVTRV
jgi:hypothetical protein